MTDHITAVTDLIDAVLDGNGLQRTTEASYGRDPGEGVCWRGCGNPSAEDSGSGLCEPCRAFLLEDTEEDPARPGLLTFTTAEIRQHLMVVLGNRELVDAATLDPSIPPGDVRVDRGVTGDVTVRYGPVLRPGVTVDDPSTPFHAIEVVADDDTVTVEPCGVRAWAAHMQDRWQLRDEVAPGVTVSTVFLGINSAVWGPPQWYETMVFVGDESCSQVRHTSRADAAEYHATLVAEYRRLQEPRVFGRLPGGRSLVQIERDGDGTTVSLFARRSEQH